MSKHAHHSHNRILTLGAYYVVYLLCFVSWILFRDYYQRKFHYSTIDIVYLVLMSLPLFFPIALWYGRRSVSFFQGKSIIFGGASLAACWYLIFSFVYYNTQEHLFDPFVQIHVRLFTREDLEKSSNALRVLALGGSTTEGFRLSKNKAYPSVLESVLRESLTRATNVFNAGVQWYTSKHSLINFVTYYQDWHPHVTVVMHGVNDLFRSCVPTDFAVGPYNDEWSHFYGPAVRGAKPLTFEQFLVKPMLHPWLTTLAPRAIDYTLEFYVSKKTFEGNMRKLIRIIKERGSIPVIMTEPSLYKEKLGAEEIQRLWMGRALCNRKVNFVFEEYPSFVSLHRALKMFNQSVRDVAASEGTALIDAEAVMSKDLTNFFDDVHHTENGANRLGRLVATELIKQKIIQ